MEPQGSAGFVRDATAGDAAEIAAIQSTCWSHDYSWPDEFHAALRDSDPEMQWARAVIAPPGPGYRVIVATHASQVVGYAALAPSQDADAQAGEVEIVAWEVTPDHRGHGHGSRLLAALADHARSLGAHSLTIWIPPTDEARRFILHDAGFAPDGAHRTIQVDACQVDAGQVDADLSLRQVRLHSAL